MLHLYIALKSEGMDWDRWGRYKIQDSDTRDPGSHPESHVCSDLDNKSTLVQVIGASRPWNYITDLKMLTLLLK